MECFICLNNIEKNEKFVLLSCDCNNSYHETCVEKWLVKNYTCPICKYKWSHKPQVNIALYPSRPQPDRLPNYYN